MAYHDLGGALWASYSSRCDAQGDESDLLCTHTDGIGVPLVQSVWVPALRRDH